MQTWGDFHSYQTWLAEIFPSFKSVSIVPLDDDPCFFNLSGYTYQYGPTRSSFLVSVCNVLHRRSNGCSVTPVLYIYYIEPGTYSVQVDIDGWQIPRMLARSERYCCSYIQQQSHIAIAMEMHCGLKNVLEASEGDWINKLHGV